MWRFLSAHAQNGRETAVTLVFSDHDFLQRGQNFGDMVSD